MYKLLSFIDHSFEEHRKILKRKQCKGSIFDIKLSSIHLLIQTCKGPDILLELAYVQKIKNFDNAIESLLLKILFHTL